MKYCTKCLQPDTRPNTFFLENGVCPACNYFEASKNIDWEDRLQILKGLITQYPKRLGHMHDCIIGVSGGKDSTRQALYLRDKLGINPLLVCLSYPPDQVTERGMDNLSNLINLGFDVVVSSPSPKIWKDLKLKGFQEFTNSFRSTELALFSTVPQIAIKYGIRLIFWGENPALQLGDMNTLGRNGYDGNGLRYMNTLSSGIDWMLKGGYELNQLLPYIYPEPEEFEQYDLQIVYLGWFLGDWSLVNNAMYSCVYGLKIRKDAVEKTGDLYGVTALDEDFTPINQLIKYYKYGFGRVTDYLNEEIRMGRIERQIAIAIVEKYDSSYSEKYISNYCEYLKITTEYFWNKVHLAVNKDLFVIDEFKEVIPKFKVGIGI